MSLRAVDDRPSVPPQEPEVPDQRLEIDEVIQQGNLVATRWTVRGTMKEKMFGVEPTGREVTLTGISLERLEDDLVVERWEFLDVDAFYRQFRPVAAGVYSSGQRTIDESRREEGTMANEVDLAITMPSRPSVATV